jgi:cytochrome c-type biogenesis protein CcmE
VLALSVAAVLAVFLLYTSIAGGSTPAVQPGELAAHDGRVTLGGRVVGPVTGDARGEGLRFRLRDVEGAAIVAVVYTGSVSDQFKVGREVMVRGEVVNGTFVAEKDSLVTKCPSKYTGESSG